MCSFSPMVMFMCVLVTLTVNMQKLWWLFRWRHKISTSVEYLIFHIKGVVPFLTASKAGH